MKNAHGRTCKKTKLSIYLYISLYENLLENGGIYIYIYIYIYTCILGRTYFVERSIHLIEEYRLPIITGVQVSGVIIDRLLRQGCFVWSEIVGPHSSGNFND